MYRGSAILTEKIVKLAVVMVCTIIGPAGIGLAQQVVLDSTAVKALTVSGVEVGKLDTAGDLYLGGTGWFGDITANRSSGGPVLYFNGEYADLTIGGASAGPSPQAGDVSLTDDDGVTSTVHLDGDEAQLVLGAAASTNAGEIFLLGSDGSNGIRLYGNSGNIYNRSEGNGLVKAWARINSDGTVASCWGCNLVGGETRRLVTGGYEVDFSFGDITARPRSAILDAHANMSTYGEITLADRAGDASSVYVMTWDSAGAASNSSFTILIY